MKWTDLPTTVVLAAADICDGHTIFTPEAFLEIGVPQELVDKYTDVIESDFSNHKSTLYDPHGVPVNQMQGVYGLDVLAGMIRAFGLETEQKLGRGFQARVWQEALHKHFEAALTERG